ncbi:MAG: DEAD/DEAH box helicase [Desulfobacterales bacterium]|nr:DEAD/DEAH box helicase [Desulfobacterales bacterium]
MDLEKLSIQITNAKKELVELDKKKAALKEKIYQLEKIKKDIVGSQDQLVKQLVGKITNESSEKEKINLFRSLFRGREDVFPKRFESKKTGKSGYQPVCRNEWVKGICKKPKTKCSVCEFKDFKPVDDEVIRNHLLGFNPKDKKQNDFTIGVYPMLIDEQCWFLVGDFDKASWQEDTKVFIDICQKFSVPAALERSRSGNGGHIWIFFSEPIPARLARQLGAFLLTQAMENRPEIGFNSYDRFFPSQDTMPKGGFGNLIALPLQKKARDNGNSVFIDERYTPYRDQWVFLSSIKQMSKDEVEDIVGQAMTQGGVLGVKYVGYDEEDATPWEYSPSGRKPETPIIGSIPEEIEIVFGNQIYIQKKGLTPALRNRLIRLAAFQNPEFYKAQAMRFPTFDKPRIIHCCEDFPKYIGLPRGCFEDVMELMKSHNIKVHIIDERFVGTPIEHKFNGTLRPEQELAVNVMVRHDVGVLSASTAFGKTVVAAYIIAKRSVNSLILVHRKQLLEQWIARLSNFLDISPKEIGQIGGGKNKPNLKIDVAMIQSLSRKGVVNDIVGKYGHLIVDECHHISARSFEIVARQCKAKFVTGLSATVIRKDGHHPIIFMNCGPIHYKVDDKKQAAKRQFEHKVIITKTDFDIPKLNETNSYSAINTIYSDLISNDKRNQLIVKDVLNAVSLNRFPLVITERKEHIDKLSDILSGKIKNVIVMKGGMGKKQKEAIREKLENLSDSESKVIIATGKYLGEGFDEPRLDTLFLTLPISWRGTLSQYAGRLHRDYDLKREVIIYDYADLKVQMLANMYERRIKGYRSLGYEITDKEE